MKNVLATIGLLCILAVVIFSGYVAYEFAQDSLAAHRALFMQNLEILRKVLPQECM